MTCAHHALHGPAGASALFLLGLAGSLHCLGMCGPLACLFSRPEERPLFHLGLYHAARLAAYAAVGAAFAWFGAPWRPVLSWPVLAALGAVPLLLWALWPRDWSPAFLSRWHAAANRRLLGLSPPRRALGLGFLTPLLPCGLLYAAAAATVAAPSPPIGALWMLAFGAGTLPLLALGQAGFAWAAGSGQGRWALPVRRFTAVLAAGTLIYFSFLG